jgi:hypothetical protein
MKRLKNVFSALLLTVGITIIGTLSAKVVSLHDEQGFDDKVSSKYPITVVMAYTQPKKIDHEIKRKLREAQSGFRDASQRDNYEYVHIKFISFNTEKIGGVTQKYQLSTDPEKVSVLLFKNGKMVEKTEIKIDIFNTRHEVYNATKEMIDEKLGAFIDRLITARKEQDLAIERAQAEASTFAFENWWNGWGPYNDCYHYGCYPNYSHSYHQGWYPGSGFAIFVD